MNELILHPTDVSQWHALVNEAQAQCSCQVDEELESYLVFLLLRFSQQSQLSASIIGMDFINSMQCYGTKRIDILRDVGDKSLLFCGLFPGMAAKRRVSLDYFVDLGQTAYAYLSELEANNVAKLFGLLCEDFIRLKNILHAMRTINSNPDILNQLKPWSYQTGPLGRKFQ